MRRFSYDLAREITRQHGIVTGRQLVAGGITPDLVAELRHRRELHRVHPGVFRVAGTDDTFEARCVAASLGASLADVRSAVAGAAAALLWDFDHIHRPYRPEVAVLASIDPRARVPGVTYRPTRVLDDCDVVRRGDSITVTGRARTWFDCVTYQRGDRSIALTRHVLEAHCDLHELRDVIDRIGPTRASTPGEARRVIAAATRRRLAA